MAAKFLPRSPGWESDVVITHSLPAYIRTSFVGFYLVGAIHALVSNGETLFGVMRHFGRERDILISSEQRRESAMDDSLK